MTHPIWSCENSVKIWRWNDLTRLKRTAKEKSFVSSDVPLVSSYGHQSC